MYFIDEHKKLKQFFIIFTMENKKENNEQL